MLRRSLVLLLVSCAIATSSSAIAPQTFTANGTYLRPALDPPSFQIGSGGFVEELDAFVSIAGSDLNGAAYGTSARLSTDSVPAGLSLAFSSTLSGDETDLLLRYDLTNEGASPIAGLSFLSFLDVEIDEVRNTFFNEYGESAGTPAAGQGWEIDEPGYVFGDVYDHLLSGALDGSNALPAASPDDVSLALSFAPGMLAPGATMRVELMISEDGDALGGFALRQRDSDPSSATVVTYSGAATLVPEPATVWLVAAGLALLARRAR